MALIDSEEAAKRLARVILSDIDLYNRERPEEGRTLEQQIEEGRKLFGTRVTGDVLPLFDVVLASRRTATNGTPAPAPAFAVAAISAHAPAQQPDPAPTDTRPPAPAVAETPTPAPAPIALPAHTPAPTPTPTARKPPAAISIVGSFESDSTPRPVAMPPVRDNRPTPRVFALDTRANDGTPSPFIVAANVRERRPSLAIPAAAGAKKPIARLSFAARAADATPAPTRATPPKARDATTPPPVPVPSRRPPAPRVSAEPLPAIATAPASPPDFELPRAQPFAAAPDTVVPVLTVRISVPKVLAVLALVAGAIAMLCRYVR